MPKREIESVDFAFMVMKVMKFYGWTWEVTMNTPTSAFWTCFRYLDRLQAEETLIRVSELAYPNLDADSRSEFINDLQRRRGNVVIEKPVFDAEGWAQLKSLL